MPDGHRRTVVFPTCLAPAMHIYLPIAEMSVNALLILGMGGLIGFMSGLFGVGGGFLLTPMLIVIGVPPPVAVATGANQIVASSVSGVLAHWRVGTDERRTADEWAVLLRGLLGRQSSEIEGLAVCSTVPC